MRDLSRHLCEAFQRVRNLLTGDRGMLAKWVKGRRDRR